VNRADPENAFRYKPCGLQRFRVYIGRSGPGCGHGVLGGLLVGTFCAPRSWSGAPRASSLPALTEQPTGPVIYGSTASDIIAGGVGVLLGESQKGLKVVRTVGIFGHDLQHLA